MKSKITDKNAVNMMAALAQETRLKLFRLLIQQSPDGLMAGEIARRLGVPNSTLSYHLTALEQADLICSAKAQRAIYYTANMARLDGFLGYLIEDCCHGADNKCFTFMTRNKDITP
ncbi:ArsR/SmtB family transcription factor [Paremcibacter congregatus]|uniref:ArsR/SmtB family transcription factor n=1 Tax=Paremcibacter congregatus TaxID=2043170 RepID=UPI001959F6CF|nr:metalloregulator ArsR/SmtB family transcription factor [Paremcibacter congregatus]